MIRTKTLMVQGTTSDAGKSTLVAGLCRVLSRQGIQVAPFKPQNMALNSAVTPCGGEIGRAQALQASAAKQVPKIDFNPILLKPNSDTGAQVIIHGHAISNMEASKYHDYKKVAMQAVLESHHRLDKQYSAIIVEGAGSPAEINLRENDIANMGFACEVKCPVIIIADIDKGGVFAHLVGTLMLLSEYEQSLVQGFVINRFRGDITLLESGLKWLEAKTGKPILGVLPYLHGLNIDSEDAVAMDNVVTDKKLAVSVLLLPHISNHTDFDSLRLNPQIDLRYVIHTEQIGATDLIIIPGSKSVINDLTFLKSQLWQNEIATHLRYGGKVLGICGGFQMLGKRISDPDAIESAQAEIVGLGLAEFETRLTQTKTLTQVQGKCVINQQSVDIKGYEIHCGQSCGNALEKPFMHFTNHPDGFLKDGFISDDNKVVGTYLHGLFDEPKAAETILNWASNGRLTETCFNLEAHREKQLEWLADECEAHLEIDKIKALINL